MLVAFRRQPRRRTAVVFGLAGLAKGRVRGHFKPSIGKFVPSYTTKRPEAMQAAGQLSMFGDSGQVTEESPAHSAVAWSEPASTYIGSYTSSAKIGDWQVYVTRPRLEEQFVFVAGRHQKPGSPKRRESGGGYATIEEARAAAVAATQTPDPERVPDTPEVAEYRAATKNLSPDTSNPRGARVFEAMKTLRQAVHAGDIDEARWLAADALPVVREAYEWAAGSEWANPKAQKSALALYGRPLKYLEKLVGGVPSAVSKAVDPVAAYTRRGKSGQIVQVGGYTRDRRPGKGGQHQAPAQAQGPRVTMKPAKHASTSAEQLAKRYGKVTADHHAYIGDRPVMLRQHGAGGKRGYAVYDADGKLMATAHVQALPDGQGAALTATWTAPEAYGQQAHSPLLRRLVGEFGKVYSPHAVHADLWATVHRMGGEQGGGEFEAADEGNRKRLQRKAQAGLFDDEAVGKSLGGIALVFGRAASWLRIAKGQVKGYFKPSIGKYVQSYTTRRTKKPEEVGQQRMSFGEEGAPQKQAPAPQATKPEPQTTRHEPEAPSIDPADDYRQNGTRAAAFKAWFGDWENDPENASKVVNEDGEPQETHSIPSTGSKVKGPDGRPVVVYHGTAYGGFTEFDKDKQDHNALFGAGFYFTEDQNVAKTYTSKDLPSPSLSRALTTDDLAEVNRLAKTDADIAAIAKYHFTNTPDRNFSPDDYVKELEYLLAHSLDQPLSTKMSPDDVLGSGLTCAQDDAAWRRVAQHIGVEGKPAPPMEVKAVYLNIRKPMDMDAPLDASVIERVAAALEGEAWGAEAAREVRRGPVRGETGKSFRSNVRRIVQRTAAHYYRGAGVTFYGTPTENEILRKAGFDGITHIGGDRMGGGHRHRVWIAFEPEQIKAVENEGTFDPENADIRKGLGPADWMEDGIVAKSVLRWVVVFGDLAKSLRALRLLKGRVKAHYKPSIGKWVPSYTTKRPEAMQQAGQMSMFGGEDEDEGETTPAPDAVDGVPTADSSLLVDSRGRFFGPPALKAFVDSKSQGQERMFSAKALAHHLQQGRLSSDFVRFLTAMGPEGVGALLQAVEQHGFYSGVNSWEEHVRHIRSRSNAENSAVRSMLGVFEALGAPSMSPTDAPRADEMRSKMMQLLPGTEASETVAPQAAAPEPPAEAAERSVVYLPGQTPAGPLMIFGLKVGDTVYPARDFAHMVGDKITGDAVGRWQSLTEEQRQLYLGKQHSPRSKSAVRARHIKDIERNGDALIATAEERSREQEEGKAEAARREGLVNTAGERGFGVRLDEIKPGMVLEHADGTRYRVTEVDEYGPIGRDLSRPRSEAPVTMGKLEHLRVVNVQPPAPDAPQAGTGEAPAKAKRSAGDPYPARRVGDEFANDDDDGGWKPASLKQHFIAAHKAGRMDLWDKLAEARRGLRRQEQVINDRVEDARMFAGKYANSDGIRRGDAYAIGRQWRSTAAEYREHIGALKAAIAELGLKRPGPDPEAASVRAKNALDMAQREADRLERDKVPANSDAGRRASENLRKRRERHEHLQAAPKSLRAVASPRRFAVIFRTRGAA